MQLVGFIGQKWGVRRYQNEDGSYTAAGRKRYGMDLDINDKSRKNVAKIRLGEARRRLDVAKANNDTNMSRLANLKQRERMAKKAVKEGKMTDRGDKLRAKGQTMIGNRNKAAIASLGATMAAYGLTKFLNTRMADLYSQGRLTPKHYDFAKSLNTIGSYSIYALASAYGIKKAADNRAISKSYSAYNTQKHFGSSEYEDVKNRRKAEK